MQLSVSSGKNSLIARAYFYAFGDSLDHSSEWPLADVVVSLNQWAKRVALRIWHASGTWEFDDSNQTDLPVATTTLVASQQDYSLPTTLLELRAVEIKDSSGKFYRLKQLDKSELRRTISNFEDVAGMPRFYDIAGNSLFLYPAPASGSVTLAAGLKIHFAREIVLFTTPATYTTADTTEPGFDESFHEILPMGAAYDWSLPNGVQDKAQTLRGETQALMLELDSHYGAKNKDKKVGVRPRIENYR